VASLVFSQATVAALATPAMGWSETPGEYPPCHMMTGGTEAGSEAPAERSDGPVSKPCPMMLGSICLSLSAASVPSPGAALVAAADGTAPLPWFEPAGFAGSVVSPPQRPPKTF
jgi:hypothetical protein